MAFWNKPDDEVQRLESGLSIEDIRNAPPQFKRIYKAKLDERASIVVTIRTSSGMRYASGELTQPNGRWVLFDPEAVAEKIIDPALVPLVQRRVDEICRLDKQFMANDPGSFIDERGTKWQRA